MSSKPLRILLREFGLWDTIRILLAVRRRRRAGEPFAHLAPPDSERDAKSRAQIAPAILLYRSLPRDAFRITAEIVEAAAQDFLHRSLGRLRRIDERWARKAGDGFFNATIEWRKIASDEVRFDVVACRFPPLCRAAGVPELAPVFCRGDAGFFRRQGLDLRRTMTIADGASLCDFRIAAGERDRPVPSAIPPDAPRPTRSEPNP